MGSEYANKRLVIWGTGNTGNHFYQRYKDKLRLNVCTSSDREIRPIEDLKVVNFDDLDKMEDYIIICSIYHEEIERRLFLDNWIFGKNYITLNYFEAIYETEHLGKKLLVSIGRCKIYQIATILSIIPAFREKYSVVHFNQPDVCASENRYDFYKVRQCMEMLKNADVLLRASAISMKLIEDYGNLQKKIANKCKVISVSLPVFGSYWPQDTGKERDVAKWYISPFGINMKAYCERDYVIEGLIENGRSKNEIIKLLSDVDFFDKQKVLDNHKEVLMNAYFWDKISDIKIADFLENNYKDKKLFCERGHFTELTLQEYVVRVLQYLGEAECVKELLNIDYEKWIIATGVLTDTESLIYPSTASALNLQFVNEQTTYRFQLADRPRQVTFQEGLEMQIEYYMKARELLKLCYVDNSRI